MLQWVYWILFGWLWRILYKWWRARRLIYVKQLRVEINYLLDLAESAMAETDPVESTIKVAKVIEATAEAHPKAVEEVKKIMEEKIEADSWFKSGDGE